MHKKVIIGTLAATMVTNGLFASKSFADEKKSTITNEQSNHTADATQNTFTKLGAQTKLMETQSLVVLKQPNLSLKEIPQLAQHQANITKHASEWLNTVQPNLIASNEAVLNFNQLFQSRFEKLSKLTKKIQNDSEAKKEFLIGLNQIQERIGQVEQSINNSVDEIGTLQNSLNDDYKVFSDDSQKSLQVFEAQDGTIKELNKKVQTIQSDINKSVTTLVTSAAGLAGSLITITVGTLTITGTLGSQAIAGVPIVITGVIGLGGAIYGITQASLDINAKHDELRKAISDLSDAQNQVTILTLTKEQINGFVGIIDKEKKSLQGTKTIWKELKNSISTLSNKVNNNIEMDPDILQMKLKQINILTTNIAKLSKQFEDFMNGTKVENKI